MVSLFDQFQNLQDHLPYHELATLPTPIKKLSNLGAHLSLNNLYIKEDDKSGEPYGGNKVRKLEFLIGEALAIGVRAVITFGYAGSNHATATAVHAKNAGLQCITALLPQHNAEYLRNNLLMSYAHGAELHHYQTGINLRLNTFFNLLKYRIKNNHLPYWIPPGGSSPTGIIGFVNAAFELKEQIDQGLINEPDLLYVASGSLGTSVGLTLGFSVLNLKTKVVAIRVIDSSFVNRKRFEAYYKATEKLLRKYAPSFPRTDFRQANFEIRDEFYGGEYALPTENSIAALNLMKEKENIILDPTYSAKALGALISDNENGHDKEKTILFWNTYNSQELSPFTSQISYHSLPRSLHPYFEKE
ncbi:MAG TPA: pyridoxal-phosphate dependent enzyme [Flavobacteriales bacterium]|nr:pyridoxal-phosphate dependent enzyme [Flavobacteriales bacterium]